MAGDNSKPIDTMQWEVFKNPAVWVLALSSACFYLTRYAINSWGVFFLEAEKGYTAVEAGSIISVNSIVGIAGTFFSGILSDKLFKGNRNPPALIFGILYAASIALFVLGPADAILDTISMVLFGLSLGVLMAVDICPKEVSGTALGIVGIASYLGAGIQDALSGFLIGDNHTILNGVHTYDFSTIKLFWLGAAVLSVICTLFVWNANSKE